MSSRCREKGIRIDEGQEDKGSVLFPVYAANLRTLEDYITHAGGVTVKRERAGALFFPRNLLLIVNLMRPS
jgi:hypothetical protein